MSYYTWVINVKYISTYLNLIKILLEGGGGIKGTVSVISSDPSCKDGNARLTMVALKPLSYQ